MIQFSVSEIQNMIQAQVANPGFASALLSSMKLKGIQSLKDAGPEDVAFFFSRSYQEDFLKSKAGLIITGAAFVKAIEALKAEPWKKSVILVSDDPYLSMGRLTAEFSKHLSVHDHQSSLQGQAKIHPSAIVAKSVKLGEGTEIGAHVVIEEGVTIESGVKVYPHCYIGNKSFIGKNSVLFPGVTLYEKTQIGERCRIHSGAVIGADGFGYAPVKDPSTQKPIDHQKIYHLGNVVIGNDVEIGANSTIDRATFGSTRIHSKVKIDNQVQIGHNCVVGEGSILCGAAGMAGSSSLGKFVVVAAQSGTGNQVHVGDYSFLAAYTGVDKDVEAGSQLSGVPARPLREHFKIMAILNKMLREREKDRTP